MNNAHQPTLYWIDYETFGTSPATDKPCQFAGIRTDMDLNIIGEPLVIYCQPPKDYLPAPEACLITGITPQEALKKGLSEPEFIKRIHQELSKENTCIIGYNNVRFDDEVTRYTLYRNFYEPYGWSWQNKNSRWDLLDVMRACYALRPDGIEWPLKEDGTPSFKLEHLSKANGIEHENAHDAMADVYATIAMAKIVKENQPKLFEYFFTHRNKRKLEPLIDLANMTPLMHVSGMLGNQCGNTTWIAPIAWHPSNKNAVISVNLALDMTPLIELDTDAIRDRLYTRRARLLEHEHPIPVKLVHLNKCPILAKANTLKPENAERLQINREQCLANLALLKSHPEIREKLLAVFETPREYEATSNVEKRLYDGFFTPATQKLMEIVRESSPDALAHLELKTDDDRIKPLLFLYRARHYPETLTEQEQTQWKHHCQDYFEINMAQYQQDLETAMLNNQDSEQNQKILLSLYQYLQQI